MLKKILAVTIILLPIRINSTFAESSLPELITKQDIKNIRFISDDGKFTYYQRHTGSLQFSTNYKVEEVLSLKERTQYNILSTPSLQYLYLEADEYYNNRLSLKKLNKLYIIKYGTKEKTEVGNGIAIGLHLNDQYISYYDPFRKKITLKNHLNPSIKTELKMANTQNPYFIPNVEMIDTDTILYTDLNKEGIPGILIHKINSKKTKLFEKFEEPDKKVEICLKGKILTVGLFGLDPLNRGSTIYQLDTQNLDLSEKKVLYRSEENDIGNIICSLNKDYIYFIKTSRSGIGKLTYDAWELAIKSKKINKISDLEFATTLVMMDKKLIIPYQNKHYVLKGLNDLTLFDKLKGKPLKK